MYAKILQYDGEEIPAWPEAGQLCYRCHRRLETGNLGVAKFGNLFAAKDGQISMTWEWFCAGCSAILSQVMQGKKGAEA